ncbi:MAG: 50S ribosomal protein L6 [Gammaproteobacteria bacterium]|nr:50S ribosomal protein L6 [Gammaproteobacteria bacterium]MDE0248582.1 50S ribosomal protein L6 [Gammaproteobacteria bacterium]
MSRIGGLPVELPAGVTVASEGGTLTVKGPNGALEFAPHPEMGVAISDRAVTVTRPSEQARHRALHGLTRSLIANMVTGVTKGFERRLEIRGVGYRAEHGAAGVTFHLGFSHPVEFPVPDGIEIETPSPTQVIVRGMDKQLVGQVAAEIRSIRPPEPYKGKGVRYLGEVVRRKAGKTAG